MGGGQELLSIVVVPSCGRVIAVLMSYSWSGGKHSQRGENYTEAVQREYEGASAGASAWCSDLGDAGGRAATACQAPPVLPCGPCCSGLPAA